MMCRELAASLPRQHPWWLVVPVPIPATPASLVAGCPHPCPHPGCLWTLCPGSAPSAGGSSPSRQERKVFQHHHMTPAHRWRAPSAQAWEALGRGCIQPGPPPPQPPSWGASLHPAEHPQSPLRLTPLLLYVRWQWQNWGCFNPHPPPWGKPGWGGHRSLHKPATDSSVATLCLSFPWGCASFPVAGDTGASPAGWQGAGRGCSVPPRSTPRSRSRW